MISMRSDSVDGLAAEQELWRDDDAVHSGGGRIETILYLFDKLERDPRGGLAAQHSCRDFAGGHAAVKKIARDGHERAGLGLTGRKTHERQTRAPGGLCNAGEARARQVVGDLADDGHVATA